MSKKGKTGSKFDVFNTGKTSTGGMFDDIAKHGLIRGADGFFHLTRKQQTTGSNKPTVKASAKLSAAAIPKLNYTDFSFHKTLYSKVDGREVPKVDADVKNPDRNMSDDALHEYYRTRHIAEYVHMEKVDRGKGAASINRLKFEFGYMFEGYMKTEAEIEDNPILQKLYYAEVEKRSFINKLNNTLRYINYFIEYFDYDDELMNAYLNMMMQIGSKNIDLDPETFIQSLYAYFSTDSMLQKISNMVEYNTDETLIKKTDRSYDESIQLTIDHLKAIMGVSCIHKFIIPIVGHYYCMKSSYLKKSRITDKDMYLMAFGSFMSAFDEYYNVVLYEKLYCTAGTRIKKTMNTESTMWKRRYQFGTTMTSYANQLLKDFIVDISQKAVFGLSAIIFIHVCFDNSIHTELIQQDKWEFSEMRMEASDSVNETMTRWDKWQTDKSFHSQKDRIRSYVSIQDAIRWMGEKVGLDFTLLRTDKECKNKRTKKLKDELDFYRENLVQPISDEQIFLIYQYYSSQTGCMADTNMLEIEDIIKIIMIMKRDLKARNLIYLRFFISSSMIPAADHRYSKRKLEKMFQLHPCYDDWIAQYPEKMFNFSKFLEDVRLIVSAPIRVCDYEYEEYHGHKMFPSEMNVVNELIRFMINL